MATTQQATRNEKTGKQTEAQSQTQCDHENTSTDSKHAEHLKPNKEQRQAQLANTDR